MRKSDTVVSVLRGVCLAVGLGVGWSGPASASEASTVHASVGYAFLRDFDAEQNAGLGWDLSLFKDFNESLGLVLDVSGHYPEAVQQHNLSAGPRLRWQAGKATPFLQALVGLSRVSHGSFSNTALLLMPGAGVEVTLSDRVGLRLAGDFLLISDEGDKFKQARLVVGVVFGSR